VKNHRYQYIGGSNVASIGNTIIDVNLLLQAHVSKDLISPKDFSSDKKVEQLFSFGTLFKVYTSYSEGNCTSKFCDYSSLLLAFFFSKLHLYAINVLYVPAKHRCFYLSTSMIYFTTIKGINPITQCNMVLESICNMFLSLRSNITKIRYYTSKLCKHMFGNIWQEKREFTCSELSDFVDKQNRRIRLNFQSGIKVSNDDSLSGYQEILAEFLHSSMSREDCSGPCKVDEKSLDPVSTQLWLRVRKVLHKSIDSMKYVFEALEVVDDQKSPLCNKTHTLVGLIEQILVFCLKTFTYNNMTSSAELLIDMALNTDDTEVEYIEDIIAKSIKKYATAIVNIEKEEEEINQNLEGTDAVGDVDIQTSKVDKM